MDNTKTGRSFKSTGDRIFLDISLDCMNAYITFNVTEEELDPCNREKLIRDSAVKLHEKGIVYGVRSSLFAEELEAGTKYLIAEGTEPQDGADSVIRMFEIEEAKPEAIECDKVDYYNLSLIKTVEAGTWLGEREPATDGISGMNVKGEVLKAKKGVNFPLHYDKRYIYEAEEGGITVLYSKQYGAVYYRGREISLMNPLVINGDVDFRTGNIMFDGCVIINGTICDGFYVEATHDIEVNGDMGLGNIKGIASKKGSVYIKGGILAKGGAKVEAAKNVYLKFIENVDVNCGGTAHIGFYCSNSFVNAREIIIDSRNGKILGGNTRAVTRVLAGEIGSALEKRTAVEITCFNRTSIKNEIDKTEQRISDLKAESSWIHGRIRYYNDLPSLTGIQDTMLYQTKLRLDEIKGELHVLFEERDSLESYLKARGDGEIHVTKKLYANTVITMKDKQITVNIPSYGSDIVFQDGKILYL